MKRTDWIWLSLLILVTLFFWGPTLRLQPPLAAGDNGRDLYAFWMTRMGKWPCRDYWWQYGPLMPLYYAFWFLVGGVSLVTVRIGLAVNYLLCSLCAYAVLRVFVSGAVAFLASLAFLSFDLTWTFNHIGAIPFLLLAIFCLWKFFLTRRLLWCYGGLTALILMTLVKITTGATSFAAFWCSLLLTQGAAKLKKSEDGFIRWHFVLLPIIFSVTVLASYLWLYRGLSLEWISQCLVARPENRGWYNSPWTNLKHLIQWFLVWQRSRLVAASSLFILGILGWFGWKRRSLAAEKRETLGLAVGSLFIFALANSFDYFAMEGLIYRFDFWIFPVVILLTGLAAEGARRLFSPRLRFFSGILIFLSLLWLPGKSLKEAFAWRTPERYLDFPHGKVYLGGPEDYVRVVKQGVHEILGRTQSNQEILALPYDSFYCFLSGRKQATRELIFLESNRFPERQEDEMIRQLDSKQVPVVLISSRAYFNEPGGGYFGKTHAQKLAQYLSDHYREVKTLGPWDSGPAQLHAIKLFERKT